MTTPVAVRYMSRAEIERLMYSLNASADNEEAQLFEALVRRLLEIMEQESY
ncbi:MAG: cell developmental protein SirA [Oceanospirillaceae bacterium]|uniref:cell developmental protein SirA n=1 Tax=unclassified Thalassolituus TaxID=2624967 RepID=UPI000C5CB3D9|nr:MULTISPECIES: cell developmental protein SirA [unclassified Thalassolituus]MAD45867.1 cell developmental protein SirA [Oceanospirillaceae bacterium]MAS25732.1 cell developmental protein SirA [Oceanospirillaceae bacterium]MAX98366.1 cell developmental protein SirA [Oceanospirillaceae bacterium]MBL34994.1 cell developmental protein SirA [Oceanospirillaceae bacterium]MBS54407.1 cell developmental protein SirA [Oceanospirillaceae bacterium]|tara:strand:- start:91482 stop:91634 length:153 start_codon:yes stop_codon:yes gene_type:complete